MQIVKIRVAVDDDFVVLAQALLFGKLNYVLQL
jgi:hypothetical protein